MIHPLLQARAEIPDDVDLPCKGHKGKSCTARATTFWPVTPHNTQLPYCEDCLQKVQHTFLVAVGLASNP